jgi:hypothetical protein
VSDTAPLAFGQLRPRRLVEEAARFGLSEFQSLYGDATMLLVRVPDGDTELELGLGLAAGSAGPRAAGPEPLPFRTVHQAPARAGRAESAKARREDPAALRGLIENEPYFAVPISKRANSDALFMGRISIGRAINKDIVLRHSSVSKFHAWFEADDAEILHVLDAGSTNLTHLNGTPLEPRVRTAVEPGDALRFGSIETLVCTLGTLWACLGLNKPA